MKKSILLGLMVLLLVGSVAEVYAQGNKKLDKAREREGKMVLKNLKNEGWKMNDVSRSLEVAILEHIEKLKSPGTQGISTTVRCTIMSNCDRVARNEAARKYAQQASSILREGTRGDANLDQGNLDAEFAKEYTGYEILVQKEMMNLIIPSYDVIRKAPNGEIEYKAFFTVNEDKASTARLKALEQSFKATTAAQKYANEIANYVKEGFKISE